MLISKPLWTDRRYRNRKWPSWNLLTHKASLFLALLRCLPPAAIAKRIDQLFTQVEAGDTLIVSELSRIGRSVGQIVRTVEALIKGKVCFIAVKEGIWLDEERNSQTQAMARIFGLLAEADRELVSIHTREGLAAARGKGKKLGRPKGSLGRSKLDGQTEEIKRLLALVTCPEKTGHIAKQGLE